MPLYLLSGGLDSVTLMHWGVKRPHELGLDPDPETGKYDHVALHFRTGLAIDDRLSEICKTHCKALGAEYLEMDLGDLWAPGCRALGKLPETAELVSPATSIPSDDPYWKEQYDYQDGRGMLFLTYACMTAANRGLQSVFTGYQSNSDEHTLDESVKDPMPLDSSVEFMDLVQVVVDNGGFLPTRAPHMYAPYEDMGMSKRHIFALSQDLGVFLVAPALSCEFSDPPCGLCTACRRRITGEAEYATQVRGIEETKR